MLAQVSSATLRILLFRAGPQDFPFDPQLTRVLAPLAFLAQFLLFVQVAPSSLAVTAGLVTVGGLSLTTRNLLRMRQLDSRYHQTFHALLATTAVLTFALVPLISQVAPVYEQILANPEILEQGTAPQIPTGITLLVNLLSFWNLAVSASIYRNAANFTVGIGVVVAVVVTFVVFSLMVFALSLVATLMGIVPGAGAGL